MVEIILAWNAHPNEGPTTAHMARKLKAALQEKNHNAKIVKVPFEKSPVQQLRKGTPKHRQDEASNEFIASLGAARGRGSEPFVIDIHATPSRRYRKAIPDIPLRDVEHWRAGEELVPHRPKIEHHLTIWKSALGPHHYVVEFPSAFKFMPSDRLAKELDASGQAFLEHERTYFAEMADLKASKAANYLSSAVANKLTNLIDSTIKKQLAWEARPKRRGFPKTTRRRRFRP